LGAAIFAPAEQKRLIVQQWRAWRLGVGAGGHRSARSRRKQRAIGALALAPHHQIPARGVNRAALWRRRR